MDQSVIHVINGGSAGGTIRQAFGLKAPRDLLISHDLYSCGPLPAIESLNEWHQARLSWWATVLRYQGAKVSLRDMRRPVELIDHAEELRNYKTVMLWIGTGLADQLLLVFLVQLLQILNIDASRLRVTQYDRLAGLGGRLGIVVSTGELNEDQFRSHPEPRSLADPDIDEINAVWGAVTSTQPDTLVSLQSRNGERLPILSRAVRSLFLRYPDHRSGLSIWDHASLQHTIENGPNAAQVVGYTMVRDWGQPDWPGDVYLYSRLQRLGDPRLAHPLVSLSAPNKPMRDTTVTITEAGRAVLNGDANAVELNGIDDWVAGVHLDSKTGCVWFNRDGALILAPRP